MQVSHLVVMVQEEQSDKEFMVGSHLHLLSAGSTKYPESQLVQVFELVQLVQWAKGLKQGSHRLLAFR
jgi:hypothetical protein